jgi:hypothetical protein
MNNKLHADSIHELEYLTIFEADRQLKEYLKVL